MGFFRRHSMRRRPALCAGRWVMALPLIAISVAIGEGKAVAAVTEPAASAATAAPGASQRPAHRMRKYAKTERRRHQLVHRAPAPDDLADAAAKAPPAGASANAVPAGVVPEPTPAFPPPLLPEDKLGLEPRSVPTVRFSAAGPIELQSQDTPQVGVPAAATSADESAVTVGVAPANPTVSVIDVPPPADAHRIAPLLEVATPLRTLSATGWLMLCGAFGLGALGGYITLAARRGRGRAGWRGKVGHPQSLSAASRDLHADRMARQRLFPHQFGTAIRD